MRPGLAELAPTPPQADDVDSTTQGRAELRDAAMNLDTNLERHSIEKRYRREKLPVPLRQSLTKARRHEGEELRRHRAFTHRVSVRLIPTLRVFVPLCARNYLSLYGGPSILPFSAIRISTQDSWNSPSDSGDRGFYCGRSKKTSMPPPTDDELLSQFRTERSEAAFRALVERHLPLVWSVARRVVNGDDALAEDVAQTVFADLARKARVLPAGVRLGGWLHRHTFFTASKAVRTEARRRAREIEAAAMNAMSTPESDLWREMAPHVDAAIAELASADCDAIVLRFFEKKPLRDIARMLGISEDAAGKRIARALERLRRNLSRRRVVLAPIIIGGSSGENAVAERIAESLAQNAVAAPPAHLSEAVATGAWSRAGAAAGSGGVLATAWSRVTTTSGLAAGVTALLSRGPLRCGGRL